MSTETRRFYVQMRVPENDVFLSANLTGEEPDFFNQIKKRLHERHRGMLHPEDVLNVYQV